MAHKIVYLFGAGASYNAIPVVSGMKYRLVAFLKYYENNLHLRTAQNYFPWENTGQLKILDVFKNIIDETAQSFSIDTLARKSFLRGEIDKLKTIKGLLGAYLLWEQIVFKSSLDKNYISNNNSQRYVPSSNYCNYFWQGTFDESITLYQSDFKISNHDYRYESLISVISQERFVLNPNVAFISWNYDNQLEIAIDRVFNIEGNEEEKNRTLHSVLSNNFIKLNGSAGLSNFDWEPISRFNADIEKNHSDIAQFLSGKSQDYPNRIKFAWEEDNELPRTRALKHLTGAEELVIIGYSFPDYNRRVDFQLLSEYWRTSPTKRITIQDIPENADKVAQRIRSMARTSEQAEKVMVYTETQQFYIPPVYLAG